MLIGLSIKQIEKIPKEILDKVSIEFNKIYGTEEVLKNIIEFHEDIIDYKIIKYEIELENEEKTSEAILYFKNCFEQEVYGIENKIFMIGKEDIIEQLYKDFIDNYLKNRINA